MTYGKYVISSEDLCHYGIRGQRWGIRRYQNKDGSLTSKGRIRYSLMRNERYAMDTFGKVKDIVDSMSRDDHRKLTGYEDRDYHQEGVIKRFISYHGDMPVSFLDIQITGSAADWKRRVGNIVVGTRAGYRDAKRAQKLVEKGKRWIESPEAQSYMQEPVLEWLAYRDNPASIRIAKKSGFEENPKLLTDPNEWFGEYRPPKH